MPLNSIRLWIVATPLGNAADLPQRAREVLESADFVLAEDTRRAKLLFGRCQMTARGFVSFHEHNEAGRLHGILARLRAGETAALISDAGLPLIADPGYRLVRACREEGLPVSVVPGPCAPVTALAGCGIAPQPFVFFGFLPRGRAGQEARLAPFAALPLTLVFFERKDRLAATLRLALDVLGDREVCAARELTKTHEEYVFGRLRDSAPFADLLGEITVVIGPPERIRAATPEEIRALIAQEREKGGSPRAVARRVQSLAAGWTGKAIYSMMSGQEQGHEQKKR